MSRQNNAFFPPHSVHVEVAFVQTPRELTTHGGEIARIVHESNLTKCFSNGESEWLAKGVGRKRFQQRRNMRNAEGTFLAAVHSMRRSKWKSSEFFDSLGHNLWIPNTQHVPLSLSRDFPFAAFSNPSVSLDCFLSVLPSARETNLCDWRLTTNFLPSSSLLFPGGHLCVKVLSSCNNILAFV